MIGEIERNLEKIDALNNIERWSQKAMIKKESVAQHSYWVSFYALQFGEYLIHDDKVKHLVLKAAVMHDFDEIFTGDISHEVKNDSNVGKRMKSLLNELIDKQWSIQMPKILYNSLLKLNDLKLIEFIEKFVKLCDWYSFKHFLTIESRLGNTLNDKLIIYCEENFNQILNQLEIYVENPNQYISRNAYQNFKRQVKSCSKI